MYKITFKLCVFAAAASQDCVKWDGKNFLGSGGGRRGGSKLKVVFLVKILKSVCLILKELLAVNGLVNNLGGPPRQADNLIKKVKT